MSDYLLTIAIPTYNRCSLLKRTLDSISCQYDERLEILISDNASNDGTDDMIDLYKTSCPYIKYIKNIENIGPDNNFLQCYRKSSGKYVLLLGSDDLLHENSIKYILDFLEHNTPDFVFLNFNTFKNQGFENNRFGHNHIELKNDVITSEKNVFMRYAKDKITFMSVLIVLRDLVLRVENPERYVDSSFIHTCLMLEATASEGLKFGIISKPCIAEDVSPQNQGTGSNVFLVFGLKMKKVFCEVGPRCGYNKKQMNKIYRDYACHTWPRSIGSRKAKGKWLKKNFKEYGFPSVKMYLKTWFTIVPCLLVPSFVYKLIFKILKK